MERDSKRGESGSKNGEGEIWVETEGRRKWRKKGGNEADVREREGNGERVRM